MQTEVIIFVCPLKCDLLSASIERIDVVNPRPIFVAQCGNLRSSQELTCFVFYFQVNASIAKAF